MSTRWAKVWVVATIAMTLTGVGLVIAGENGWVLATLGLLNVGIAVSHYVSARRRERGSDADLLTRTPPA